MPLHLDRVLVVGCVSLLAACASVVTPLPPSSDPPVTNTTTDPVDAGDAQTTIDPPTTVIDGGVEAEGPDVPFVVDAADNVAVPDVVDTVDVVEPVDVTNVPEAAPADVIDPGAGPFAGTFNGTVDWNLPFVYPDGGMGFGASGEDGCVTTITDGTDSSMQVSISVADFAESFDCNLAVNRNGSHATLAHDGTCIRTGDYLPGTMVIHTATFDIVGDTLTWSIAGDFPPDQPSVGMYLVSATFTGTRQ